MLSPFTKLNFDYNMSIVEYEDILHSYGKGQIRFYKISQVIENYLLSFLPEYSRRYFKGQLMKIDGNFIKPHTDSDRLVTINFYVKPDNAITFFWSKKSNISDDNKVLGQTTGSVYEMKDLVLTHKFVAEPNSAYILDVGKIHSVHIKNKERLAYCLASNFYTYEQTVDILKDNVIV